MRPDNFNYQASSISVVDLVRHVPSNIVKNCMEKIKVEDYINQDFPQTTVLNLKDYVQEKGFIEQVSNITGTAIPLYYEWHCKKDLKKVSSLNLLLNFLKERRDYTKEEYPDLFKHEKFIKGLYENEKLPVKDLLLLANIWIYIVDKFNFKLNQISNENYNWITEENLSNFMQLMEYHISTGSAFEQPYTHSKVAELYDKTLNGFIDCIDFKSKNVWEFKCVSRVTDVHFLQLAVYAYLFEIKQQERVSILNKKANDIFSLNKIEINDIIEICKWNQVYFANFQRFKQNKIIILKDNKIKKVKLKHFQKNITLEKKFNVNRKTFTSKYNFFLFNILKNKIYRLSFEFSDLKKIVDLLVWNKFFESGTMTDIEFMSSNQKIKDRYI
ncbi:hypothetical protein [Spiroplasma endosymbiont of Dilophus febrilis]|uniref:hypothetical protein n=1 Tax=Spiroplasma endosymbiont of Dilophus febrilis TaxID=3066292 RepID=UPI00313BCB69